MSRRQHKTRRVQVSSFSSFYLILILHSTRLHLAVKMEDEYKHYRELPPALLAQQGAIGPTRPNQPPSSQKLLTAGRTSPLASQSNN